MITLRPRQHDSHLADDNFKYIFLKEKFRIPIENSPKFVPKGPINNNRALVPMMMIRLQTHISVTGPQ